ncbi:MAG: sensor histidine kinase [Ilumatobacteraceae bacterium]|jgi:signal transduction histidine kinase
MPTESPPRPDEAARLRQLVWFDVATACTAVVVMGATYAAVLRSTWLVVLCVLVAASGLVMATALVPLRSGDLRGAVACLAAANWAIAPASTLVATFAWPLMLLAALLPAVLAAPYVSGRRLRGYVVSSFGVAIGVVALGVYQDVTGFTDDLPSWVPPLVLIVFAPFLAGMVVVTALQHSTRLQTALAETVAANAALRASRARLVAATDRERRRVERDLHDGAQQRLVALGLRIRTAENLVQSDPAAAAALLADVRSDLHTAHQELRDLAHGVYPPVLTQHGLRHALAAAADRCPLPVVVAADGLGRYSAEVEAAVYFGCVEALQNAAKHAGPSATVSLAVRDMDGEVEFAVADDGVGFDITAAVDGFGLVSMRDRIGAAGGDLAVESATGSGTTIIGRVPADR